MSTAHSDSSLGVVVIAHALVENWHSDPWTVRRVLAVIINPRSTRVCG